MEDWVPDNRWDELSRRIIAFPVSRDWIGSHGGWIWLMVYIFVMVTAPHARKGTAHGRKRCEGRVGAAAEMANHWLGSYVASHTIQ